MASYRKPLRHPALAPMLGVAVLSLVLAGSIRTAESNPLPSRERIESLCHPWTPSPCILRVGGSLRRARSGGPLQGKRLRFLSGETLICTSTTDRSGHASCSGVVPSGRAVAESGYRILFDGDARFTPGSAAGRAGSGDRVARN
ncbi:MAG: hypothetical protein ACREQY_08010 [Candidatus Binatia bacterium]